MEYLLFSYLILHCSFYLLLNYYWWKKRYWKSLNKTLDSKMYLYFAVRQLVKYANKLPSFFPSRRVIGLEIFPDPHLSPSSSSSSYLPLEPFTASTSGDLEKLPSLVSGVVASNRALELATTSSEWGLVPLLTFMDFARRPSSYRVMLSLKAALTSVVRDERVVSDLLGILLITLIIYFLLFLAFGLFWLFEDVLATVPSSVALAEGATDSSHARGVQAEILPKIKYYIKFKINNSLLIIILRALRAALPADLAGPIEPYLHAVEQFLSN